MIECDLRGISEYVGTPSNREKFGRYHGSSFWDIPDFGTKKWVVAVYIDLDFDTIDPQITNQELLDRCVEFLNVPPPRRKYQKKKPQPRYGVLSPYRGKVIERDGKKTLSALLITENRKNKLFWSEGKNVPARKKS